MARTKQRKEITLRRRKTSSPTIPRNSTPTSKWVATVSHPKMAKATALRLLAMLGASENVSNRKEMARVFRKRSQPTLRVRKYVDPIITKKNDYFLVQANEVREK